MRTLADELPRRVRRDEIDWDDPAAIVIDGFTVAEIRGFSRDSVVTARCSECGEEHDVEPDAEAYDCDGCGTADSVTSPLVKLGLI